MALLWVLREHLGLTEGSVGFGLSMARFGEITLEDGVVQQNFFSDYHVTRMHTMPPVESYLVPSEQGPSGASETVACVVAPALANALARATDLFTRIAIRRFAG